ncbi:MAG: hypothetical protein P1U70_06005 [Saprospiraceae bacterium]|nr:hypothetical protein [Saprospiraceae bacterium]
MKKIKALDILLKIQFLLHSHPNSPTLSGSDMGALLGLTQLNFLTSKSPMPTSIPY